MRDAATTVLLLEMTQAITELLPSKRLVLFYMLQSVVPSRWIRVLNHPPTIGLPPIHGDVMWVTSFNARVLDEDALLQPRTPLSKRCQPRQHFVTFNVVSLIDHRKAASRPGRLSALTAQLGDADLCS